jgi:iron complex transport system substrate-binding protein
VWAAAHFPELGAADVRTRFLIAQKDPTMSYKRILIGLLVLVYPLASVGTAAHARAKHQHHLFPVTMKDDTGYKTTFKRSPRRIVTLDPRDTETVFALGLAKRLKADGGQYVEGAACCDQAFAYPRQWPSPWGRNYPVRAKKLTHIEGGYDAAHPFDIELVEKEHPGLVIVLDSDQTGIQQMRSVGLKVVVLNPRNLRQITHDIRLVGRITGHIKKARLVVHNIDKRYEKVAHRLRRVNRRPRVFYELDDTTGTPYTACHGSFIDDMLKRAKATNVAHNVGPCPRSDPYPQMSTEALIKANPQIILLGDSDYGVTPAQVRARSGWNAISAVKHNRIYTLDDDLVSRAGPREVVGLERVASIIHPRRKHRKN